MFDANDQQLLDLFWALAVPVVLLVVLVGGGVLHGLHREYRQYLAWRKTHAAWKAIVEGDGK